MSETERVSLQEFFQMMGAKYTSSAHPGVVQDAKGWFRVIQDSDTDGWYWFPIGGFTGRQKGQPRGPFETVMHAYENRLNEYGYFFEGEKKLFVERIKQDLATNAKNAKP